MQRLSAGLRTGFGKRVGSVAEPFQTPESVIALHERRHCGLHLAGGAKHPTEDRLLLQCLFVGVTR
jgi:hypothetical protein